MMMDRILEPMRTSLARLYRASIWHPDAIPLDEYKYRNSKRILFPLIDITILLMGAAAFVWGIPSLSTFYDKWVVNVYSITLSSAAVLAFIGVAFPSMWKLELGAKATMLGQFTTLAACLIFLTADGNDGRGYVAGLCVIAGLVVGYRISVLASEWQARKAAAEAAEAANQINRKAE
jgi:hypothetical protein